MQLQSFIADRWVGTRAAQALASAIDGSVVAHTHEDRIDFGEAVAHARGAGVPALLGARLPAARAAAEEARRAT